jgi:glutamyl-tRNA reductase
VHLIVLGLNHNSATIELRECVAVADSDLPQILSQLVALDHVREVVVLSTCNRTEFYVVTTQSVGYDEVQLSHFMASLHNLPISDLTEHLYRFRDEDAVRHLMSVAAGLDSMMVGEYQIMSQVKSAYAVAQNARCTDSNLNALFQHALSVGKKVRTDTEISRGAFSIGAAAVEFGHKIFGDSLSSRSVLLIGAGQISELAARHLQARGVTAVYVANRTFDRAVALANQLDGAMAVEFDKVPTYLVSTDIVICSTSAAVQVVTREMVRQAMHSRRNRPLYLVDIAVPRDVEASAGALENVFLYNIDDLSQVVQQSQQDRMLEVQKARQIVNESAADYMRWRQTLNATPLIVAVRERLESHRLDEMARLRAKIPHVNESDIRAIEQSLQSFSNKVAHDAIVAIKESSLQKDAAGHARIAAIKAAFGLGEKTDK